MLKVPDDIHQAILKGVSMEVMDEHLKNGIREAIHILLDKPDGPSPEERRKAILLENLPLDQALRLLGL